MRLIDIGVNLIHPSFDKDREQVLRDAEASGISPLVITGTNVEESKNARWYAASHNTPAVKRCFSTAGVHPHDVKMCDENTIAELSELAQMPEVAAIGECGLDYNRDFSPRNEQRVWFERQVELAAALNMPLFLHERDAFDDFYAILKKYPAPRKVAHCFTGGEKELDAYLSLGCYIGITGWICDERRGTDLLSLVKKIPSDRLLLETDAPYLLPRNIREKKRSGRNEPKNLTHIARYIADIVGKDPAVLAEETFSASLMFFFDSCEPFSKHELHSGQF
ncbi:MAG: TatD family hydrolase [Treponema sp.]|jgi:TatD DNase family protein|nr:TatD family hydrolase [Treponema sp.]